jgi:hypothetical protein
VAGCQDEPAPTDAKEEARIERGMEKVAAGQARSEAHVAEVEAARRVSAKEERRKETRPPE